MHQVQIKSPCVPYVVAARKLKINSRKMCSKFFIILKMLNHNNVLWPPQVKVRMFLSGYLAQVYSAHNWLQN